MESLVGLVREFPIGSLVVILSALWATGRCIVALVNISKPAALPCTCACCQDDDELQGGEEEEDE